MTKPEKTPPIAQEDDRLFLLLRQLDNAPNASQRASAAALGVSLGAFNGQIRAAADRGLIKIADREGPDRRQRFAYALTPKGAAEKRRLSDSFLKRKFAEYDALHAELTGSATGFTPFTNRTDIMQNNLAPITELFVSHESSQKLKADAGDLPSWDLTLRQICDLEMLMNGAFVPRKGFLGKDGYDSVVDTMRLADGSL